MYVFIWNKIFHSFDIFTVIFIIFKIKSNKKKSANVIYKNF